MGRCDAIAKTAARTTRGCRGVEGGRVENGGCETAAPFEIVTMINRVGIVYLGGASPSTCTWPKLYFSRIRIRENGGYMWEVEREDRNGG